MNGVPSNTIDTFYCVERPRFHENETSSWAKEINVVDWFNCALVQTNNTEQTAQIVYGELAIPVSQISDFSSLEHNFLVQTAVGTIDWFLDNDSLDFLYRPLFSIGYAASLVDAMDELVAHSIRAEYAESIEEEVPGMITEILPHSYVSLSLLVLLAICLGSLPEVLTVRVEEEHECDLLRLNQYDTLSKACKSRFGCPNSSEFAVVSKEDEVSWMQDRPQYES